MFNVHICSRRKLSKWTLDFYFKVQCFDNYRKLEEIRSAFCGNVRIVKLSNASSSTVRTQRKLEIPTTKGKQNL